jgi:hypothetical protein
MNRVTIFRKLALAALAASLAFGLLLTPRPAQAAVTNIKITFVHAIDGKKLGLSRGMPLEVRVYKGSNTTRFETEPILRYRMRYQIILQPITYRVEVYSKEQRRVISSMTIDALTLKPGDRVVIRFELDASGTPVSSVRKR